MIVTLEEMKQYLRVDFDDDDSLIETLITSATRLCMDITRQNEDVFEGSENAKPAVFYAVAYLYEHREEADHHALTLTLRSLLFGSRKEAFEETVVNLTGSGTLIIENDFMPVVPVITATSETALSWTLGSDSFRKSLSAGTWTLPEFELQAGRNTVTIQGAGTTTFRFREGRL